MSKDVVSTDSCMCGCGGGACVPQRNYGRLWTNPLSQHDPYEMILFSVNGKCGYPLEDALEKKYAGLDRRDDKMLVGFKSSVSLRLEVRLYRQDPMTAINPVYSGSRIRPGQNKSVTPLVVHSVGINETHRSKRWLGKGSPITSVVRSSLLRWRGEWRPFLR